MHRLGHAFVLIVSRRWLPTQSPPFCVPDLPHKSPLKLAIPVAVGGLPSPVTDARYARYAALQVLSDP